MSNNNVISQVEINGEYKSVIATVPLTGTVDLMKLNNTLMQVETSPGVFKTVMAVANLAAGGGIPNPSRLNSYLPTASPYTTPVLSAGTPTKLLVPTTVKTVKEFTLDAPNARYFLDAPGVVDREFDLGFSTSMSSVSSNHTVTLEMYKNGVLEEGVGIDRFISGGADVGAIGFTGTVLLSDTDYIEVYITASGGGAVTLSRLSISINEKLGAI